MADTRITRESKIRLSRKRDRIDNQDLRDLVAEHLTGQDNYMGDVIR